MPYNGVGSFTSLGAPTFPAIPNTYILASYFNATINDIFSGLSSVMTRDGQSPATANIPMGGNKLTGLGVATLPDDAVRYSQVSDGGTFANANLTGVPVAPTPGTLISTTQIPTTAWVGTWFAPLANPAFTGVPTVPTAAAGTSTGQAASTAFVQSTAFAAALPSQIGSAGKVVTTDGSAASWASSGAPAVAVVTGTTQTAVLGTHYVLTNVALSTLTLPATPASGDTVWATFTNGLATNVIARNGKTIMGLSEDMTVDSTSGLTIELRYVNADWRLV